MAPIPSIDDSYRSSEDSWRTSPSTVSSSSTSSGTLLAARYSSRVTVLIGPKQAKFKVNRKQLCAASFFREQLQQQDHAQSKSISLWLPGESPAMFALFVEWLHDKASFRCYLDDAINDAHETSYQASRDLHWALIHLHLFASHLSLYHLQDLAMDAVQDLYLRCNWDVPPSLIAYLYTKCESLPSVRLRRWAVAMVAFSLAGGSGSELKFHAQDTGALDAAKFQSLLESLPELAMDYTMHMRKMKASRLNIRLKNPQLRIPANKMRNEERAFGFRSCSFHSHRAAVGQRQCPHDMVGADKITSVPEHVPTNLDELSGLSSSSRPLRHNHVQPVYSNVWEEDVASALGHVRSVGGAVM
ncbi:hypothetical protein S40285_07353 [Stachybotrys chlorohalonatus IBT 40285]|uniref:BTB domain-containing protein n=1 Tax=Stachybotrys chlorohalonatus (strain IBT 40285) TaxID=1283841 RepID=A0A084Q9K6_STAC4|nr:hypothetical protein S40285_07353 [Stachybotrys chlorohalonata IBT 40285]